MTPWNPVLCLSSASVSFLTLSFSSYDSKALDGNVPISPLTIVCVPCFLDFLKNQTHTSFSEIWMKTTVGTLMEKQLPGATQLTAM
jgi:hypothetical protein